METIVLIIACLLLAVPMVGAAWIWIWIIRDVPREQRAFYAAQAARQHGKG